MDLPDAENRMKILRIFLSQENLEPDFQFDKLAYATEGYSGSDLKVMHLFNFHSEIPKFWMFMPFLHVFTTESLYCCII